MHRAMPTPLTRAQITNGISLSNARCVFAENWEHAIQMEQKKEGVMAVSTPSSQPTLETVEEIDDATISDNASSETSEVTDLDVTSLPTSRRGASSTGGGSGYALTELPSVLRMHHTFSTKADDGQSFTASTPPSTQRSKRSVDFAPYVEVLDGERRIVLSESAFSSSKPTPRNETLHPHSNRFFKSCCDFLRNATRALQWRIRHRQHSTLSDVQSHMTHPRGSVLADAADVDANRRVEATREARVAVERTSDGNPPVSELLPSQQTVVSDSVTVDTHHNIDVSAAIDEPSNIEEQETAKLTGYAWWFIGPENPFRLLLMRMTSSDLFEYAMFFMILLSCIAMTFERPSIQPGSPEETMLFYLDAFFTVVFGLEFLMKSIALSFSVYIQTLTNKVS